MSDVSNAFLELVKKRYQEIADGKSSASLGNQYRIRTLFCEGCAQETLHDELPDEGIYEVYRCRNPHCRMIKKIAVR